ncbi:MAG: glucose-1-phosphate cytidylyltransferase [Candidatus Hydrogenedentes bacterium]|nr:glucose-1-phosphate cytidylyltransferase [Candidatus Hydrogenedentota bacterium]
MKVLILCGGIGTRLKEETEFKPKPMVNIGERPILWHIMKHYAHFGHNQFVLALGYKGEMIKQYFIHHQLLTSDFTIDLARDSEVTIHRSENGIEDWRITLVDTGLNALKGARIKRAQRFIEDGNEDDVFLMTYGDGVSTVNLDDLLAYHRSHGRLATVTGVIPSMRFGEIRATDDGTVDFEEKGMGGAAMVNGGYYVLSRKVFDYLEDADSCDFEMGPLEILAKQGELKMYRHEGFWHCMDNIRDMEALNGMWYSGTTPWVVWK